jgi:hypothetical protein
MDSGGVLTALQRTPPNLEATSCDQEENSYFLHVSLLENRYTKTASNMWYVNAATQAERA